MSSTQPHGNGKVRKADAIRGRVGAAAPGARLSIAFEAVERFPALVESRAHVMNAASAETPRVGEVIGAVETDVALTIGVLRMANHTSVGPGIGGIPAAIEALQPPGVVAVAGTASVFDFFEPNGGWDLRPEQFRVHALAAQQAAEQIGRAVSWPERDELVVAALLHDIGRLVISKLHPGHRRFYESSSRSPEHRIREERDQLGIDHALVGGVLARRWNLPQRIAVAIERHHAEDAEGLAALVATADMVAHYSQGEAVTPERMHTMARRCGLGSGALREILYELPYPRDGQHLHEPCPLSARELDVLRHLSEGMVYKQIAGEMQLSVSTIRTHLHNVYGKIDAVDRAQAVLTARDRGWI
jgi:putative nucleotidyltransferase with HDIG domain